MIWLTGGSLAIALLMIVGLLGLIAVEGFSTFWPAPVVVVRTTDGRVLAGEIAREEAAAGPGDASGPPWAAGCCASATSSSPASTSPGSATTSSWRRASRSGCSSSSA
jgi:hypothetical protein